MLYHIGYKIKIYHGSNFAILFQYHFPDRGFSLRVGGMVKYHCSDNPVQNPIIKLGDISTETGTNIQQGYMEMFAGAMIGIRNPQAHNNLLITKDNAIRELHFASMLMYKIDDELV